MPSTLYLLICKNIALTFQDFDNYCMGVRIPSATLSKSCKAKVYLAEISETKNCFVLYVKKMKSFNLKCINVFFNTKLNRVKYLMN